MVLNNQIPQSLKKVGFSLLSFEIYLFLIRW